MYNFENSISSSFFQIPVVCVYVRSQGINASQRYNNGLKFRDLSRLEEAEGELCR